jgi:hypothetical protein
MDALGLLQSQVGPGAAAVQGAVDAVPHRGAVPGVPLAGADPDDVRGGLVDGHGADGGHRLIVEDRLPGEAAVDRLPDASGGGAHVDDFRVGGHRVHGGHPAAHAGRADGAGLHARQEIRIDGGIGSADEHSADKNQGGVHGKAADHLSSMRTRAA